MQIPKGMVVERIRTSGDVAMADRAEAELPEKIDTERDAELLRKFNLDPQQLADGLGGQAPAIGRSTLLDAELCCALSRSAPAVIERRWWASFPPATRPQGAASGASRECARTPTPSNYRASGQRSRSAADPGAPAGTRSAADPPGPGAGRQDIPRHQGVMRPPWWRLMCWGNATCSL
jgi:hypothetical protein